MASHQPQPQDRSWPTAAVVPDNNEEYLLYQTLVGAWPLRMDGDEERARVSFAACSSTWRKRFTRRKSM